MLAAGCPAFRSSWLGAASLVVLAVSAPLACGDSESDRGSSQGGEGATSGDGGDGGSGGGENGGMGGSGRGGSGGSDGTAAGGGTTSGGGGEAGGAGASGASQGGAGNAGNAGNGGAGEEGGEGGSDDGGEGGSGGVSDPDPNRMIGPLYYASQRNSPFIPASFQSYFYFEDWEDRVLDQPGVTSNSSALASAQGPGVADSADIDDGVVNGMCGSPGVCEAAYANPSFEFTFDEAELGGLPTHVGIAWVDCPLYFDIIFEAYDGRGALIGTAIGVDVGNTWIGCCSADEDKFFGVVWSEGVGHIVVRTSPSDWLQVDHLQYGR